MLTETLAELAAHGIDGVSVDRIARAAKVNKTSVYRRFGTREALVAAALQRVAGDVSEQLTDQGSLRGDLMLVAERVAALLASPIGASLARAALSEPRPSPLSALATREMEGPRAAALAMVERARARGEWRAGVGPEAVLAALVGALLHKALLERRPVTKSFVREVVEVLAGGVMPR